MFSPVGRGRFAARIFLRITMCAMCEHNSFAERAGSIEAATSGWVGGSSGYMDWLEK